ncbi:type II toxin-antitoxin system VapC family toxin [Candidatus Parcubacteria bacterium]|nr:type II toxin-antitoxin system VapC family toxin [Candidatus Parcubacteria bacterium]
MEVIDGLCIDYDILIDYLRGVERARGFLLAQSQRVVLCVSIINVVELYAGRETRELRTRRHVDAFVENFAVLDLTLPIAKLVGQLRRDYQKPFADMIVAASALSHRLPLATKNLKHFQAIQGLRLVSPY